MKNALKFPEVEGTVQKVRSWLSALVALVLVVGAPAAEVGAAVGISTRFVDVTIEYVQVGKTYNLRELRRIPYAVTNRGSTPMDIVVDVLAPRKYELVEGYEAIPDAAWLRITPNRFRVEPGQTGYAEMIIAVPNDPQYTGRHYQARIWAHTDSADLIAAGIESRLKFSTGPGPATLKKRKKELAMMTLDFEVTPRALYIENVKPGQKINLRKFGTRRTLKVTNRADTPLRMKFVSIPWDLRFPLSGEFKPATDPAWLSSDGKEMKVKSNKIEDVDLYLTIPDKEENYGKQFAFLVKTELIMGVELEVFNQVYVTTAEKGTKE